MITEETVKNLSGQSHSQPRLEASIFWTQSQIGNH